MKKVTVYNYEGYSVVKDEYINHGKWATMEYINARPPLIAIKENMLEVPISSLDSEGRYIKDED
jgi:hypothetical protein